MQRNSLTFMASNMEKSPFGSKRHDDSEFNLKEWELKARIRRENTSSRRFSASNIRSYREDARSFRSNITICSTVSSPGYTIKDEIDPSTYSFTTALKALQAKTVYSLEYLSPDGFVLNSKQAEKEGEVHLQYCPGESQIADMFTKALSKSKFEDLRLKIGVLPKSFKEENWRLPVSMIYLDHTKMPSQVGVKETKEREDTKGNESGERKKMCMQGGCLSLRNLWMRKRQKKKQESRNKNTFLYHLNAC
ncbi:uncharacterized protein LOC111389854 [Olea europaea var. sylvestris]|uniref:uncharacterized protein LOC111389854 n=1 Tax=Olea europaea var. sylvestris TaxID=158386 RepID=UPI000C1CCEC5|nr:uncharacterized protein LOC111389854 [Olea europaea var. sylvestris]